MNDNVDWPFCQGSKQVAGMKLPEYLEWANGTGDFKKKLFLPPIQRGFVWKPKQIVDLWDSLLRGMPIGSLMLIHMSKDQEGRSIGADKSTEEIDNDAMGLLDGQQRTLAMLLGWSCIQPSQHCLWIDLGENGQAGSPFELRITSKTQPFGFQRFVHVRLSRHDRKKARESYDEKFPEHKKRFDYDLFDLNEKDQPRPWKADKKIELFVRLRDAWGAFRNTSDKVNFIESIKDILQSHEVNEDRIASLYEAFERMKLLEVPLILIPDHISQSQPLSGNTSINDTAPLILLFERIGQNAARLSPEDLLFSMIKQQWPMAHDLVEGHRKSKVGYLMSSIDYVATAYRLGSAERSIADNPRPNPNDYHRNLEKLLGKDGDDDLPLRKYLKDNTLVLAFDSLYAILTYKDAEYIGLPDLMLPYLSRGLIQVLLRWVLLNLDNKTIIESSRKDIIAFALFWYLSVWNEDKASKKAFEVVKLGAFPAAELYEKLTDSPKNDEIGLMLPLVSFEKLETILVTNDSPDLRSKTGIFKVADDKTIIASVQERELYKRFCWDRKHLLLWFQRSYVQDKISKNLSPQFFGLTDEDAVPYDYDHLCPQSHWGADWRNITKDKKFEDAFYNGRSDVGNCIGNLHVLESSLNRSFGDDALETKLESPDWKHADSQLYHDPKPEHEELWKLASPTTEGGHWTWDERRLQSFQSAVYRRAFGLYGQFYDTCKCIIPSDIGSEIELPKSSVE